MTDTQTGRHTANSINSAYVQHSMADYHTK